MKKTFNLIQWVGLAVLAMAILWLTLRPSPPIDYKPDTWTNWDGFMAVSYTGVTRGGNSVYVSSKTLVSHLEAFHKAGYHTITPADALAFLQGRAPLPDKALLILFEGARKETSMRALPALRRFGMQATLCVPATSPEGGGESCLMDRDIRKLSLLPQWSIASMGYDAANSMVISAVGATNQAPPYYRMAFVSAANPMNPPGRDCLLLSRIRIAGDWSAERVLGQLWAAKPLRGSVSGGKGSERWALLKGARWAKGCLRLKGDDAAWVRGSDRWTDVEVSADVGRSTGAVVACYARFISPSDCVRLTLDDKEVRLQETRAGVSVEIGAGPVPGGRNIHLGWRVRGLRAWVTVNGHPLFGPVPLAEAGLSGTTGFECGSGSVSISNVSVSPLARRGIMTESWGLVPADKRLQMTDYYPPLAPVGEISDRQCVDFIQAVAEGVSVWPVLLPGTSTNSLEVTEVEVMDAMLTRRDMHPFVKGVVIDASRSGCIDWLHKHGFKVMFRMGSGSSDGGSIPPEVDDVWIEGSGTNAMEMAQSFLRKSPPWCLRVRDEAISKRFPGVGWVETWGKGKQP